MSIAGLFPRVATLRTIIVLAIRADAMLEAGDLDDYAVWKRILRAVRELEGTVPKSGEVVH